MKMNIKKVATILGSALMLGATAGMAAAAAYPAPFVSSGSANVAIVVGGNAALSDGLAASAIAADLATDLAAQTATSATTSTSTATGGDAVLIEKSSTKWQLGDTLSEVRTTSLDDNDMETLLADGKYLDDDNEEYDFKQSITPSGALQLSLFDNDDYKTDAPSLGIEIEDGEAVMNYSIDFTEEPTFDVLETTDLPVLAKSYYVLSVGASNDTITLLDSAVDTELNEGETTTLTVDGKAYEVSAKITSSNEIKLTVNGESTKTLDERQTYKLSDGAYVGIKDISYNAKESGVSSVEFSIGKGKLILTNNDEVQINDEDIDNLKAFITNNAGKLGGITLQWSADGDMFVADGSEITMPGFGSVKMSFGGMVLPAEEEIVATVDGDNNFYLKNFPTKYDAGEDIYLLESNSTNFTILGKDDNNKVAIGPQNVNVTFTDGTHDYFVLSYKNGDDAESYFVRATNFDDSTTPDQVDFEYLSEDSWKSLDTAVVDGEEVTLGSAEFTVGSVSNEATKTVTVFVSGNNYLDKVYSKQGLAVQLPWINTTAVTLTGVNQTCAQVYGTLATGQLGYNAVLTYNNTATATCTSYPATYSLVLTEEDKDDAIANGGSVAIGIGLDSEDEVYVTGVTTTDTNGATVSASEIGSSDIYVDYVYSDLATKVEDDRSGDHETVKLTYHGAEVYGQVFITDLSATISATSGSTGSATQLGAVTVKDSEVSSVSGKNLIVIGGSCVNSVAAELLGGAACEAAFTAASGVKAGEALIKSFTRGDKVALLVAGYNAEDTTKAATYLTMKGADTTVGAALKVTSATEATAITA